MTIEAGTRLTVDVEKPAAGGRMLARHAGQVVLVWGAIPGERVDARVERVGRGVVYAETIEVLTPSSDRRQGRADWRCGGNVYTHISYTRQRHLKGEIIRDALARIGRVPLQAAPDVIASPERGYRMRARLHAQQGRLGFFREGTHQLCDAASTDQLLPETNAWIAAAQRIMQDARVTGVAGVEIAENMPANERACHLMLDARVDAARCTALFEAGGLTGLSAERADRRGVERLAGTPSVSDVIHVREGDSASALRLRRDVRAFFQGNRFVLEALVRRVGAHVPDSPVIDLYAGVGLFGLSLAAAGRERLILVEGDPVSGGDLQGNAEPFGERVRVERRSVESFLRASARFTGATVVVDPPRTGMSKEALGGIVERRPARVVYVSCDVATLARDTRVLLDAGYSLDDVTGIDMFPNTAHVETVAAFRA